MAEENNVQSTEAAPPGLPGAVISPGGAVQPVAAVEPETTPQPTVTTNAEQPQLPEAELTVAAANQTDEAVTWAASEFIAHHKSVGWYGLLALTTVLLAGVVFVLTRDNISTAVVIIGAIVLGGYGARQPNQVEYRVDAGGVGIGQKYYDYDAFRSFAIVPEGAFSSIVFMPLKRFGALTTIYYAPQDEDRILDLLEPRLPLEEHSNDALDRLMHRIRF